MRRIVTERNLVVVLFVMVIITFSFAERDTKKIEHLYIGVNPANPSSPNTMAELKVKPIYQPLRLTVSVK